MLIDLKSSLYEFSHNISHVVSPEWILHAHDFYELYYFVEGNVDYLLSGTEYSLTPHAIMLISPNTVHGFRVHSTHLYERYTLHFDKDAISPERRSQLLKIFPDNSASVQKMPACWRDMQNSGVLEQINALSKCQEQNIDKETQRLTVPIILESILAQTLLHIRSQYSQLQPNVYTSKGGYGIVAYLDEHFTEPISLDQLSERFFLSKSQLNALCRKVTGTTLIDYVIRKRINYAQLMLSNGVPATRAADAAGFNDYTSFYRAYVKHLGYSPSKDLNPQNQCNVIPDFGSNLRNEKSGSDSRLWNQRLVRNIDPNAPKRD